MKTRVLIVDDDLDYCYLMKVALESAGPFEVRTELHSLKAAADARSFRPDLILLDCMMPELGGGEVASVLQNDPVLKAVPVAFLTATVSARTTKTGSGDSGPQTYLPKVMPMSELLQFIEEMTGGRAATGG